MLRILVFLILLGCGDDGRDGINGINGIGGTPGPKGKSGIDGLDGASGLNGKDGTPGLNGNGGVEIDDIINAIGILQGQVDTLKVQLGEALDKIEDLQTDVDDTKCNKHGKCH